LSLRAVDGCSFAGEEEEGLLDLEPMAGLLLVWVGGEGGGLEAGRFGGLGRVLGGRSVNDRVEKKNGPVETVAWKKGRTVVVLGLGAAQAVV
jgi:hypothetical protein